MEGDQTLSPLATSRAETQGNTPSSRRPSIKKTFRPWLRAREIAASLKSALWGYDFFVSYHWASGGSYAVNLAQRLRDKNYDVFLDRAEYAMGDDWRTVGQQALKNTQRLVLVASREAVTISAPVEREVVLFTDRGLHVIPILFGDHFSDLKRDDYPVLKKIAESQLYIEDLPENLRLGPAEAVVEQLIRSRRVMRRRNVRAVLTVIPVVAVVAFAVFATGSWINAEIEREEAVAARIAAKAEAERAISESIRATQAREDAEEGEYRSNMRLVNSGTDSSDLARNIDLLWKYHPRLKPKLAYRGFEWNYLWRSHRLYSPPFRGHTMRPARMAWSRDGKQLAVHGEDNRISVINIETGQPQFTRNYLGNVPETLDWSADGERLIVGANNNLSEYRIRVLDRTTGDDILNFDSQCQGAVHSAWSAATSQIAAVTATDLILCNVDTGENKKVLPHDKYAYSHIAFSPDGSILAIVVNRGAVGFWRVGAPGIDTTVQLSKTEVDRLYWSPDGTRLAASTFERDYLIDPTSGKCLPLAEDIGRRVRGLAWSPDSGRIATIFNGSNVKIWDKSDAKERKHIPGRGQNLVDLCWSPDGNMLATTSLDKSARIWNARLARELDRFDGDLASIMMVRWSPDGRLLAGGALNGVIRIWDKRLVAERSIQTDKSMMPYTVIWSPDSSRLAGHSPDGFIRSWDPETTKETHSLKPPFDPFTPDDLANLSWSSENGVLLANSSVIGRGTQRAVAWDAYRNRIISAFDSGPEAVAWAVPSRMIRRIAVLFRDGTRAPEVWDLHTNNRIVLTAAGRDIHTIAISPSGKMAVTDEQDRNATIYSVDKNLLLYKVDPRPSAATFVRVDWSPDEKFLLVSKPGNQVVICDGVDGRNLMTLGEISAPPPWSPDGLFFASPGRGSARVWRADAHFREQTVTINTSGLTPVIGWTPFGHNLFAGHTVNSYEGWRVVVWDVDSDRQLFSFNGLSPDLSARSWTRSGDRMVVVLKNQTIRICNGRSGAELIDFPPRNQQPRRWVWSPDGLELATVTDDEIRIIDGRPIPE